jgi:hypothetical protein
MGSFCFHCLPAQFFRETEFLSQTRFHFPTAFQTSAGISGFAPSLIDVTLPFAVKRTS